MNPIKFYRVETLPETGEVGGVYFTSKEDNRAVYICTEGGFEKYTEQGTVTSVSMSVPEGLQISGSPITDSGTIAVDYQEGYSIPTVDKQTTWDNKQDAMTAITAEEIDAICG